MMHEDAKPAFQAPPLACDAHFHVFGPAGRYPARDPNLRYEPPFAPLDDYLRLARTLGVERFVFVQPSAYARDNSCMLDAMSRIGAACRGIVDVGEEAPDAELARLHAAGVRGVRVNVSPVHPFDSELQERLLPRIDRLEARCLELGWQLDFLLPGWLTQAMMERLSRLRVDFTLAHMGMFLAKQGPEQPGFRSLVDLLRRSDNCWVKLTGVYRMSQAPGFADAGPMARALVEARPDRIIWGSDYPHLSFADKVGSVELFNLLGEWVPEEGTRRRILTENPARLFGF
jgi:predicted TIM-barrel fold metal-dependent hydrolase